MPLSESRTLLSVVRDLEGLVPRLPPNSLAIGTLDHSIFRLRTLADAAARGVHTNPYRRNPYLYVYNPPAGLHQAHRFHRGYDERLKFVGIIAHDVHDIRYEHESDGHPYRHDFETRTVAEAAVDSSGKHVVLLVNMDGHPVWEDR